MFTLNFGKKFWKMKFKIVLKDKYNFQRFFPRGGKYKNFFYIAKNNDLFEILNFVRFLLEFKI